MMDSYADYERKNDIAKAALYLDRHFKLPRWILLSATVAAMLAQILGG